MFTMTKRRNKSKQLAAGGAPRQVTYNFTEAIPLKSTAKIFSVQVKKKEVKERVEDVGTVKPALMNLVTEKPLKKTPVTSCSAVETPKSTPATSRPVMIVSRKAETVTAVQAVSNKPTKVGAKKQVTPEKSSTDVNPGLKPKMRFDGSSYIPRVRKERTLPTIVVKTAPMRKQKSAPPVMVKTEPVSRTPSPTDVKIETPDTESPKESQPPAKSKSPPAPAARTPSPIVKEETPDTESQPLPPSKSPPASASAQSSPGNTKVSSAGSSPPDSLDGSATSVKLKRDYHFSHNKKFTNSPHVKVITPVSGEDVGENLYAVSLVPNMVISPEGVAQSTVEEPCPTTPANTMHTSRLPYKSLISSKKSKEKSRKESLSPVDINKLIAAAKRKSELSPTQLVDKSSLQETPLKGAQPSPLSFPKFSLPYPCETMDQNLYFNSMGLIKKSELKHVDPKQNKMHREGGGRLRRSIKTRMDPQMVYKKIKLGEGCVIHGVRNDPDREGSDYSGSRESSPRVSNKYRILQQDQKCKKFMPDVGDQLGNICSRVPMIEMKKVPQNEAQSPVHRRLAFSMALKNSLAQEAKKNICIEPLEDAIKRSQMELRQAEKQKLLQQKRALELLTKKSEARAARAAERRLSPTKRDKVANAPTQRRSTRQTKRKGWSHLLRANPDEYEKDSRWESEQVTIKERRAMRLEKIQAKLEEHEAMTDSITPPTKKLKYLEASSLERCSAGAVKDKSAHDIYPVARTINDEPNVDQGDQPKKLKKKKKKKKKSSSVCVIGPDGRAMAQEECDSLLNKIGPMLDEILSKSASSEPVVLRESDLMETPASDAWINSISLLNVTDSCLLNESECVFPHMCRLCEVNDHDYQLPTETARQPHMVCIHQGQCRHLRHPDPHLPRLIRDKPPENTKKKTAPHCEADLLCCEEMLHESEDKKRTRTDTLSQHIRARERQIIESLGVTRLPDYHHVKVGAEDEAREEEVTKPVKPQSHGATVVIGDSDEDDDAVDSCLHAFLDLPVQRSKDDKTSEDEVPQKKIVVKVQKIDSETLLLKHMAPKNDGSDENEEKVIRVIKLPAEIRNYSDLCNKHLNDIIAEEAVKLLMNREGDDGRSAEAKDSGLQIDVYEEAKSAKYNIDASPGSCDQPRRERFRSRSLPRSCRKKLSLVFDEVTDLEADEPEEVNSEEEEMAQEEKSSQPPTEESSTITDAPRSSSVSEHLPAEMIFALNASDMSSGEDNIIVEHSFAIYDTSAEPSPPSFISECMPTAVTSQPTISISENSTVSPQTVIVLQRPNTATSKNSVTRPVTAVTKDSMTRPVTATTKNNVTDPVIVTNSDSVEYLNYNPDTDSQTLLLPTADNTGMDYFSAQNVLPGSELTSQVVVAPEIPSAISQLPSSYNYNQLDDITTEDLTVPTLLPDGTFLTSPGQTSQVEYETEKLSSSGLTSVEETSPSEPQYVTFTSEDQQSSEVDLSSLVVLSSDTSIAQSSQVVQIAGSEFTADDAGYITTDVNQAGITKDLTDSQELVSATVSSSVPTTDSLSHRATSLPASQNLAPTQDIIQCVSDTNIFETFPKNQPEETRSASVTSSSSRGSCVVSECVERTGPSTRRVMLSFTSQDIRERRPELMSVIQKYGLTPVVLEKLCQQTTVTDGGPIEAGGGEEEEEESVERDRRRR